ncbi:apoptosis regulator BAX-like isoform X1 [Nelusetta ayraudi]|uniref:apoptosis regulator BAX-like isoform X1 n=1 Tax=Nelusetta ayraudi TaxID=303726 RepID=UPI003F6EBD0D
MSEERIGEAAIQNVIQGELQDAAPAEVLPLTPLGVMTEQDRKTATQLGNMIRIVGDGVKGHKEFQDAIDAVSRCGGSRWESFKAVAEKVFQQGITWERIAVLFYVAGRLAVRMVELSLPQFVKDILRWTVDFFRTNLLSWIREHGGWVRWTFHPFLCNLSGQGGQQWSRLTMNTNEYHFQLSATVFLQFFTFVLLLFVIKSVTLLQEEKQAWSVTVVGRCVVLNEHSWAPLCNRGR